MFFVSATLSDGNAGFINSQSNLYTKMEGEDFRIALNFQVPIGSTKYLCRNDCKKEDVLIQTHGNRVKSGRYIIRYDNSDNKVHVVITELTRADAGRYKVGVRTSPSICSHQEFEIRVRGKLQLKLILSMLHNHNRHNILYKNSHILKLVINSNVI